MATDHDFWWAKSSPQCTGRTELVPAPNPEAQRRWGKWWLTAQTSGVRTDAGRTARTQTTDEHWLSSMPKLSAAAIARSHGRPCQRPLINPEGSGQLYHHGRRTACSVFDSTHRTAVSVECPDRIPTVTTVEGQRMTGIPRQLPDEETFQELWQHRQVRNHHLLQTEER